MSTRHRSAHNDLRYTAHMHRPFLLVGPFFALFIALNAYAATTPGSGTPSVTTSQQSCTNGRTPNAEEIEMGFPPNVKICPSDQQRLSGGCPEQPYAYLKTKYSPGAESATEGGKGISMLNPEFACRLYKFFKAADQAGFGGKVVNIHSAWRSNETQARLFNAAVAKYGSTDAARKYVAPPGNSMHNKGLAVDLGFQGQAADAWAHKNLATYALYQRMGHEPWHIEPSGGISGSSPGTGSGGTTPGAYPQSYGQPAPYGQATPLGYGYGQNTSQGPCPYGYVYYNSQCYSLQNQQPLGGMQQYPMQQQQQPYGSSGGSGYPSSGSGGYYGPVAQGTGAQTGIQNGTSSVPNNQSIIDRLTELANATTSTSTVSSTAATTTARITSTTSIAGIEYNGRMPVHMPAGMPVVVATDTIAFGRWIAAQQTFGQSDAALIATSSPDGIRAAFSRIRQQLRMLITLIGLMRSQQEQLLHLPEPQLIYSADVLAPQEGDGD